VKRLRQLVSGQGRVAVTAAIVALVCGVGVAAGDALITGKDIRDGSIHKADLAAKLRAKIGANGTRAEGLPGATGPQGPAGQTGETGAQGQQGLQGAPGQNAFTKVTALPAGGFSVTNASCSITPDGVECGPYVDGGAAGGSVCYDGLNGQPLSAVKSLVYFARYTSDGDTNGVGVPYLRVFLNNDNDDAIFSPNTQPPDPDVAEGPFHTWVATSGVWRYDDDGGSGGPGTYGVNGAPFSTLITDHGTETISGLCITTGFTAGTNLNSLLRSLKVNGTDFEFTD
jgi:hypothetical protein